MSEIVTTRRIIHIDPHQLGKIVGLLYCVLGVLMGVIVIIVGLVNTSQRGMIVFGVLAPLLYGGMGYISAVLGAALFNWAAGRLGGVRVTIASDAV